jgi:cardiolipin synthase C
MSLARFGGLSLALCIAALLSACNLPPASHPEDTRKAIGLEVSAQTRLGQAHQSLREQAGAAPETSGIYPLTDPQEAFAARALLARHAEKTLDVQYYIWRDDKTGLLLLHELLLAADRGVRVRLLLDDGGTSGLDAQLMALHRHPHAQVRVFNPFVLRNMLKPLGYVTEFSRTNRRMHNKSFSADAQATIVGGRNVGNEYFGATNGVLFADLDILVLGPVVQDIEEDFDRYWNNVAAYPIEQVASKHRKATVDALRSSGAALAQSPAAQDYRQALERTSFVQKLLQADLPMEWATARLLTDPPEKIQAEAKNKHLIGEQLRRALGNPQHSLDLVSPYFVPTQDGADAFAQLRASGPRVRILTNALEATDVAIVHSGYAKYRKPLLRAGVQLYEMRAQAPEYADEAERVKLNLSQLGSSGSSLHAKTFAVDGKRAFVGSFNFDPRSMHLNTEMGLIIDSPTLARQVSESFDQLIPSRAFRLSLTDDDQLRWHSGVGDPPPVYDTEPQTRWYQRWMLWFLGKLPIEWML